MVRLVFRPYTHIWRSICTSESLRASIRVSPDFALLKHSSPSFGSQHMCSLSNPSPKIQIGQWCKNPTCIHFHCAILFLTVRLAQMLDSLVRVSRRVANCAILVIKACPKANAFTQPRGCAGCSVFRNPTEQIPSTQQQGAQSCQGYKKTHSSALRS